jgi:hypothetical protein
VTVAGLCFKWYILYLSFGSYISDSAGIMFAYKKTGTTKIVYFLIVKTVGKGGGH